MHRLSSSFILGDLRGVQAVRDLILTEVLTQLTVVHLAGQDIAIQAPINFRTLGRMEITLFKTIDILIATASKGYTLLQSSRGFAPFMQHPGLHALS